MWDFDQLSMPEATLHFAAGDTIISEGERGHAMYAVLAGKVEISVQGHGIDWLEAGNFFGEMALIDDKPRSATARAATPCRLLVIDHPRFFELVHKNPEFALHLMTVMSTRMRRSNEEEVKRQRMEEELAIGRQIQLSLLPEAPPEFTGWEIAAFYRAAREVGGDLYDFVTIPAAPNLLNLVIADVTGKGVPAALFMAISRTFMRTEIMNGLGPADIMASTNQFLLRERTSQLFLSSFVACLDTASGLLSYASGGHESPLVLRSSAHFIDTLVAPGLLLGVFSHPRSIELSTTLAPGDVLVLYTDGITEARNPAGELFGDTRLRECVLAGNGMSADRMTAQIVNHVEAFAGAVPQSDDLTLLVVRRSPH